jgi:hypothetical protein
MKIAPSLLTAAALVFLAATQANAATYTYADNWVNWPGYTSTLGDENGHPVIDRMIVNIEDNGTLQNVSIVIRDSTRLQFDSLFISTGGAWDSWDYFVHDGGTSNSANTSGTLPGDGLYKVASNYDYTYVTNYNRVGNPNGIDAGSLTSNRAFGATVQTLGSEWAISYDFTSLADKIQVDPDEFFIAYAPYCDNDIIGGGTAPVPEPATMLLFGTGLAGLATIGRRKMKRD